MVVKKDQIFPCPRLRAIIWSCGMGSAVPSRVSLLISIPRQNLVLTYGIPPDFRGGVHLFIETAIIGPVQSLKKNLNASLYKPS